MAKSPPNANRDLIKVPEFGFVDAIDEKLKIEFITFLKLNPQVEVTVNDQLNYSLLKKLFDLVHNFGANIGFD